MVLRFLYHSGFIIEADGFTMVIDYYKDDCDGKPSAGAGVVADDTLQRPGGFYVLCSHAHHDHYNKHIFDWSKKRDIHYIMSSDIRGSAPSDKGITFLGSGDRYRDDRVEINAYGSTDVGISFVIRAEGKTIFHAGDLNNWHWNEECKPEESAMYETSFLRELDKIYADVQSFDLAMFPVDRRLGKDFSLGAEQFMDKFKVNIFAPMHFEDDFKSIAKFQGLAKTKCRHYKLWAHRGETIEI